jgi:hypothetical protein
LVVRAGDGLLFEDSVIQRHIPMRTASAISLELTTRWPDQEHALATGLKEAHAPFTHSTRVTDKGERHRGRLLKMNV